MDKILVVNKDTGYTSRDVVNIIGKHFNTKKIGHTGTLDPIATGVLVICMGKSLKVVDLITSYDKEYVARVVLGIDTDTLDITGNRLRDEVSNVTKDMVVDVLNSFLGKSIQEVPKYSAIKVNGKKLYEYARNGESVVLPTNEVDIYDLSLINYEKDKIVFKCKCSKGTYIRSLINKICDDLGVIGTMSDLVRTKQGKFDIKDSFTIKDVQEKSYKLLNLKDLFTYKTYDLNEDEYNKVKNGNHLKISSKEEKIILYYDKKEIAIYKKKDDYYVCDIMLI